MLEAIELPHVEASGIFTFLNGHVLAREGDVYLLPLAVLQNLIEQHGRVITDLLHLTPE